MPIEFLCEHCGTKLRTPDGSSGKKTKCPKCEALLAIPEQSAAPPASVASPPPVSPPIPPAPVTAQQSNTGNSSEWQGFESPGSASSGDFDFSGFTESGNPWQAPVDYGPEPRTFRAHGTSLDFSQAFDMTYKTVKSNFLPFFILGIIGIAYYAIIIAISMSFQNAQDPNLKQPETPLFDFANSVVSHLLGLGLCLCALELIRTRKTSLATGFSILPKILHLIVFWILFGLLVLAVVGLPVGVIALVGWVIESAGGIGLGWIIGFCLGIPWIVISSIVLTYRLGMYGPLLIVDQRVSALQAFSISWAMTKRNTLTLFCIFLVFGLGAAIAACCTLALGLLVIVPFGICLTAMCYHIMWEQYSARTAR